MRTLYFIHFIFVSFLLDKTDCVVPTSHVCEYVNPECHNNCPLTERCQTDEGKISHCFALYSTTTQGVKHILRKGCWLQNLLFCPLNVQCRTKPMSNKRGLQFCCCTGDNCNAKIY